MLGKSHVIVSEAVLLSLATNPKYEFALNTSTTSNVLWFMGGVALGTLLPDIDQPDSILGRFNPLAKTLKHRTITHTLWAAILVTWLCWHFGNHQPLWYGLALGYWAHLLEDFFSRESVPWLYPLVKKKFHHWGYTTGGWFEKIVVTIASLVLLWKVIWILLF